ncbi:Protein prune 2 [Nymphon striatum]|nr:Protein prune 2 [Nymphon striatum]
MYNRGNSTIGPANPKPSTHAEQLHKELLLRRLLCNMVMDFSHFQKQMLLEEEKQDLSKSLIQELGYNHIDVDPVEASTYTAQTVDFPDSPHQLKLLQQKSYETQGFHPDDDYDEDELRAALSPSSNQSDRQKVIKYTDTMPLQSPVDISSDVEEEYFEDDLMGGLNRSYSVTDTSHCDSISEDETDDDDDDELSSDQLEMKALEQMVVKKRNSMLDLSKIHHEKNIFDTNDNKLKNGYTAPKSKEISDKNNNTADETLHESFLFDEKASNDGIDKATLQKIRVCFDGQRIKDLYMLSGRLQDIISPEEIEEILSNVEIYSEFIDDDVIEALTSLDVANNIINTSTSTSKNSISSHKKTIGVENHNLDMINDECRIRAVFEQHCKGPTQTSEFQKSEISQTKMVQSHSGQAADIRAFFEESLVKSASTLKIIHAKMDDSDDSNLLLSIDSSPEKSTISDRFEPEIVATDLNCHNESEGRPCSLDPLQQPLKRKILVTPDILRSKDDDQKSLSSISNHSETDMLSPSVDDLITPDDIDTPDELDESILERFGSIESDTIPEMSAAEEYDEERSWRTCFISGIERRIDLKVIEPYKKVLSHGGYYGETRNAIILFSACYLPDRSRRDYDYVMDNLFLYVLTTLDALVAEDYILVYLHGATQRSNMPSFGWLKRCYQMIDRRLRKNLKQLLLVHPSFWVKTIVIMTKPFISSKFSRKLKFISNLLELSELIPMDDVCIPDKVKQIEFELMIKEKKRQLRYMKSTPHQRNLGLT